MESLITRISPDILCHYYLDGDLNASINLVISKVKTEWIKILSCGEILTEISILDTIEEALAINKDCNLIYGHAEYAGNNTRCKNCWCRFRLVVVKHLDLQYFI